MERWKQVHQLLSAKKIRKMLNLCGHGEASRVVKEHSGKFKHDIIESLEEKATLRKIKIESKRRGNEEANISRIPFPNRKGINNFLQSQPHSKSQSQS